MILEPEASSSFRPPLPDFAHSEKGAASWSDGTPVVGKGLTASHPTVLHALAAAAELEDRLGITLVPSREGDAEEQRSYRQLYHESARIAAGLKAVGLNRGDRVLLVMPTCFEFVTTYFGVLLAGGVPTPTYPPAGLRIRMALDRLCHVARHSGARFCVATSLIRRMLGELRLNAQTVERVVTAEELAKDFDPGERVRRHEGDGALIQYTSGSTGKAKGVLLSHRSVVSNIHAIGLALEMRRSDVVVSWLPLYHDMGLIGTLLFSIYWQVPLALMSPVTFLTRPVRWLETISRHRGTMSPAPNFAYGLCNKRVSDEQAKELDLSSWRSAMNGAEVVNMRTVIDFQRKFEPAGFDPDAVLPVYGLAECSLAVTFPRQRQKLKYQVVDRVALGNGHVRLSTGVGSTALVGVGKPIAGHSVRVVDETGADLPERRVGHIVVSGPSIMLGYFENQAATDAVLRDGWLSTGDLGYLFDGDLYIAGRAKDLIILRGHNVYAEDLERTVERIDGVRAGNSVAFSVYDEDRACDAVIVVCETRATDPTDRQELEATICDHLAQMNDVHLDAVVLVEPGTIPKTSSGKKQRSLCREQYIEGKLGQARRSKLQLAVVVVRSAFGHVVSKACSLFRMKAVA